MKQDSRYLKKSFDILAKKYDDETNTFHHKISSYVTIENLLSELPGKKNIKILDSGGGTGQFALFFKKLGYDIILSDISHKSIEEAKIKAAKENLKIFTYVCNSEQTPFQNNSFDFIMMNGGVISYSPNPKKLLKEANRLLKHKGILWFDFLNYLGWAIETTDPEFKIDLTKKDEKLIQMSDWDYPARVFSLGRIRNLLEENQFKIKSQYGLISLSHSLPLKMRYSKNYDKKLLEKYKRTELELSRRPDCIGLSWSCSVCAIKV